MTSRGGLTSAIHRYFTTSSVRRHNFDGARNLPPSGFGKFRYRPATPESHKKYDAKFGQVVDYQNQLKALKDWGFRRPYKSYQPTQDLESRFLKAAKRVLPSDAPVDMGKIDLENDLDLKSRLMNEIAIEFGRHYVPNSMNHLMTSLDQLFHFYSVPVDENTSYERLEAAGKRGELPPNLHVQLDPLRFDPERAKEEGNSSPLSTVTAYPGQSTILSTPESRKKYKPLKAKRSVWKYVPEDNKDQRENVE